MRMHARIFLLNWPTLTGPKPVVLAVANTMDFLERVMSFCMHSRLGELPYFFDIVL